MAVNKNTGFNNYPDRRMNLLFPIVVLWGAIAVLLGGWLLLVEDFQNLYRDYYLLPWAFVAGIVILAPSAYLFYKKKFDLFHPLVYAAWSYIFPAFVIGAIILSFGWSKPYFLLFIEDPEYNLPLSLIYISVGFLGMTVGYFLPIGRIIAEKVDNGLPKWEWNISKVWLPGILLLLAGIGINILGFIQGVLGFQRATEIGIFDGLLFFMVILFGEGTILLWLAIFQTKNKTGIYYIVLAFLILLIPLRMAFLGSRGSLLIGIIPIMMAFQYSGRKVKRLHAIGFGFVLIAALFVGIIYGTTFRNLKGSEARANASDYVGQVFATIDYLSTHDLNLTLYESGLALAERVDTLSSLGVVVANHEKLAQYEAGYGLENNIINDLYTSFIPRFIWADKPQTSDPRAYGDLYFNFGDNSFAITPFGDLLRNFGPIGVPLGMLILGIYLRVIYSSLIDTPNPAIWKKVAYFPLLSLVSYEAFYATIFPSLVRTLFILALSLFLTNLLLRNKR
ncbi:MAG: hypothetical protein M3Q99_20020 [Acidobacteriota bacterium]|nr:hypothetical protein [Acidobacteriota bacterium]